MKALVTGGGGFLGKAICRQLKARGDEVRSYSRGEYPELADEGIEHFRGDLTDREALKKAAQGCEVVFHVAAKAGAWGPYEEYYQANYVGTEKVIEVCRELGIKKLVYTSSPSVVFQPKGHLEGVDESVPYADSYQTHYPKTKGMAEKLVVASNGDDLQTVSLRPHLIWGPEDNHLVPRILRKGAGGQLRIIGHEKNLVDTVYIDNAAEAHLLAADALGEGSQVAGKVYFISNDDPIDVWEMVNNILEAGNIPPVTRRVPFWPAYLVGVIFEVIYTIFRIKSEPRMTRFIVFHLASSHWFDISAAKNDLGYEPKVSMEEGLKRLTEYLKDDPYGVHR